MLDGQLQHLDLLETAFDVPIQDDRLKIVEPIVLLGKPPQAGEAAVTIDDPSIVEYYTWLPLIHHFDVGLGLADSVRIALHNELLNDLIVGSAVGRIRSLSVMARAILADPSGDPVILVVVKQPVQPDLIHGVCLGDPVDGQFSGQGRADHGVLFHAFFQQTHVHASSK